MKLNGLVVGSLLLGSICARAADEAEVKPPELEFKSPDGAKAFDEAKRAFAAKNLTEAKKQLQEARKEAENRAAKEAVQRYIVALGGLGDLILLERKLSSAGGWVYENAQRKFLVHFGDPAGDLFRALLDELEKPERKLVEVVEGFEQHGPYSEKYGKTFVHKAKEPQFVIAGDRSLRWECKNRDCVALKISGVPKSWAGFDYLGFWLYMEKGKESGLELFVANSVQKGKRVSRTQRSFNGYQAKIPAHQGWKFLTFPFGRGKGLRKVGTGNLESMEAIQIQLPTVKRFVAYIDQIVLVRKQ